MKKLFLLLLLMVVSSNCERDDICDEGKVTTPRLYIGFYDIDLINSDTPKNVVGLRVQGIGNDDYLATYSGNSPLNEIYLPLKTTEDQTQYSLIRDYSVNDNDTPDDPSDDFIEGNEDIITISYQRETEYVSRACGYKTNFAFLTVTPVNDGDNWIQAIQYAEDNMTIENEQDIHVKIYH